MYLCLIILTNKTMAKNNLWTLLLVIFMALTACTKDGNTIYQTNPDEEKPSTAPLVTVIYGPNSLGDRSYCDKISMGVEAAAKKYGVRTLQLSPESEEQGLAYLEMMFQQMENATDSVRRLFVIPTTLYDGYIRANNKRLEKNPNADLLYLETTTPLDGKGSTFYIDYYGAMYMGGCLIHYEASQVAALILANPYTESVREAGKGFQAGFNDTPQWDEKYPLELHVRYLSEEPEGGFEIADSTAIRIILEESHSWFEHYPEWSFAAGGENNLTIVPVCGGAMNPLIRSVLLNSDGGFTFVGVDRDMAIDWGYCSYSIVKHIDKVMEDYIGQWLNSTMPKHQTFGLSDGVTGIVASDQFTQMFDYYQIDMDILRQVAIGKEEERYGK